MEHKYEIDLDLDPMKTQVAHPNHLVEYYPRDNELSNLLSNYEKPFNDNETDYIYNENTLNWFFQLNQPFYSFFERKRLNKLSTDIFSHIWTVTNGHDFQFAC